MKDKTISIALLIALVGFPQISETIYTPALPSVASDLNAGAHLVEMTLAIYFAGFAAGVALWGGFSDWSGRRIAMLAGILLYLCATTACANAGSIEALLTWRFVQAFGASVGSVITQTILRDVYDGIQRAKLFSIMSGALAFSPAIGPILGGFISEYFGWRGNFWFLTITALIFITWTFFALPETRSKGIIRPTFKQIKEVLSTMIASPILWGHIVLIGTTNGIIFSFYQEAPFMFIEQLGMQPSHYGFLGLIIAAASVAAARLSYFLITLYSAEAIIRLGCWAALGGSVLFSSAVALGALKLDILLAVPLVGLSAIFLGIGLIIPNSLSLALKPYQLSIGTAGSIFGGLYYCFVAFYTWIMSLLHNGSISTLPLYMMALALVLLIGSKMILYPSMISNGKLVKS